MGIISTYLAYLPCVEKVTYSFLMNIEQLNIVRLCFLLNLIRMRLGFSKPVLLKEWKPLALVGN